MNTTSTVSRMSTKTADTLGNNAYAHRAIQAAYERQAHLMTREERQLVLAVLRRMADEGLMASEVMHFLPTGFTWSW